MTDPTPTCTACGAPLTPGARFCHRCGGRAPGTPSKGTPWIVAWSLIAILLAAIVWQVTTSAPGADAPVMANVGSGTSPTGPAGRPPDISQMSPRERFLRLSDRIEAAAESGDTATVRRFAPMALAAYGLLESADVDVRYHAAMVHLEIGAYAESLALADTIQAQSPRNLLGYLVQAAVAEARNDSPALERARRAFLASYADELGQDRPEYQEHRELLKQARDAFSR